MPRVNPRHPYCPYNALAHVNVLCILHGPTCIKYPPYRLPVYSIIVPRSSALMSLQLSLDNIKGMRQASSHRPTDSGIEERVTPYSSIHTGAALSSLLNHRQLSLLDCLLPVLHSQSVQLARVFPFWSPIWPYHDAPHGQAAEAPSLARSSTRI